MYTFHYDVVVGAFLE